MKRRQNFHAHRPHFVYLLLHEATALIKIGVTVCGSSRLSQFEADGWSVLDTHEFASRQAATLDEGRLIMALEATAEPDLGLATDLSLVSTSLQGVTEMFRAGEATTLAEVRAIADARKIPYASP